MLLSERIACEYNTYLMNWGSTRTGTFYRRQTVWHFFLQDVLRYLKRFRNCQCHGLSLPHNNKQRFLRLQGPQHRASAVPRNIHWTKCGRLNWLPVSFLTYVMHYHVVYNTQVTYADNGVTFNWLPNNKHDTSLTSTGYDKKW